MQSSDPTDDPRRSGALRFWRALTRADEDAAKEALEALGQNVGEDYSEIEFASSSESGGKFVHVELPATSPKNAQDAWKSEKKTSLMRVDPQVHCLSIDGDARKYDGGSYFVACASPSALSRSPSACTVGTHTNEGRPRAYILGPAYLVKVKPSSVATKPKVLTGPCLLEQDLPEILVECGCGDILQSVLAPPVVWKMVLESYPGYGAMLRMSQDGEEVPKDEGATIPRTVRSDSTHPSPDISVTNRGTETESSTSQLNHESPPGLSRWQSSRHTTETFVDDGYGSIASSPPGFGDTSFKRYDRFGFEASWRLPYRTLRRDLERIQQDVSEKLHTQDRALAGTLDSMEREVRQGFDAVNIRAMELTRELELAYERIGVIEEEFSNSIHPGIRQGSARGIGLSVNTGTNPEPSPSGKVHWEDLDSLAQQELVSAVTNAVKNELKFAKLTEGLDGLGHRVSQVEKDVSREQSTISKISTEVESLVARKNVTATERGGYVFNGPADVQALVHLVGPGKLSVLCLDLHALLTLAQDPFVTYEGGIQAHANAIKANFGSVLESRLKLSFELPFPEMIIRVTESAATSARGGAKWAPLFASAEMFEDDFRDGAHRRVLKGIENAYDLTQRALDQEFPSGNVPGGGDSRKIHAILSDQNRKAYRQTTAFIESLLPFYRTLKGGGLSASDAWDRVLVLAMEILTALREVRVVSSDLSEESAMIWGCLKATDLGEEFRNAKFVEHHKALAILSLTSIEREGRSMNQLEDRLDKRVAEIMHSKADKTSMAKLDTRVQAMENKHKKIEAKYPELK